MDAFRDLLGDSPVINGLKQKVARVLERSGDSRRLPSVVIQGETGAGKGLLARILHQSGPRPTGPFVDVNCAAIPATLLEAEMFGFERGAFTDARQAKLGLFQAAHRGTIFLDEIGLLPEALQSKLLKVIEERQLRRLGSTRNESVDVWIIAATSENLEAAIRERRFREDLYHRLAVLTLMLPPLRERNDDVIVLAEHFLAQACADYGIAPKVLSASARRQLLAYQWPGNVRELSNVMERVALLSDGDVVTTQMLGLPGFAATSEAGPTESSSLDKTVGGHLLKVLTETDWNVTQTAVRLGISRNTVRARMARYGLQRPQDRQRPRQMPSALPVSAPDFGAGPPSPLEWEPRRATFLGVRIESPGAGELVRGIGQAAEILAEKVRTFGGHVEVIGPSELLAMFGLESSEDAVVRAGHASLAIQRAAARIREGAGGLTVRVGLHVDQVLVRGALNARELALEARRDALDRMTALLSRAEPDTIVVTDAVARFLNRRFTLVPLGLAPEHVFRLVGRTGVVAAERSGVLSRPRLTFVGRGQELEVLQGRLEAVLRGNGQVVGIVGEAGIGKSRLVAEFCGGLTDRPLTCLEGHCVSHAAVPYAPVLDLVGKACALRDIDSPAMVADKIRRALTDVGMESEAATPYLLHLLGVKEGTESLDTLPRDLIAARVVDTLRQFFLRLSRRQLLVLIVEDLHWVNKASEAYFSALVESLAGGHILMVTTYRPGYLPPWIDRSFVTQIALQPLTPEDGESLVREALRGREATPLLVDRMVAKAGGNPFFLEELARSLPESESEVVPAVPDTVQEVLLARIERLISDDQQLLRSVAVIGKDVPWPLLRAIATGPDEVLRRGLNRLQAVELLYEVSEDERVYTFKHALTHEVASATVPVAQRRVLHAKIVEAIERVYAARLPEHVEELAHHAREAGQWEKAVAYFRQSGARAFARSAHGTAVSAFEEALAALERIPDSRERRETAVDLRFDLRNALLPLGEHERYFAYLKEAEELAAELAEPHRLGWVAAYMAAYLYLMGDQAGAIACGERARAIAESHGYTGMRISCYTWLGQAHYYRGEYEEATALFRRNVATLRGDLEREPFGLPQLPSVHSRTCLVWCLAELGGFAEGVKLGHEAIAIAESVDHPLTVTVACAGLGVLHLRQGEVDPAMQMLERAFALCQQWRIRLWFPRVASALGALYTLAGRPTDALRLLEEARVQASAMGLAGGYSALLGSLSEACLRTGRVQDAARFADEALALARIRGERGHEAWALRLRIEVGGHCDTPDLGELESLGGEAFALATKLEMRPLLGHLHMTLANVVRRHRRDGVRAHHHLEQAQLIFADLGMSRWRRKAEEEAASA